MWNGVEPIVDWALPPGSGFQEEVRGKSSAVTLGQSALFSLLFQ